MVQPCKVHCPHRGHQVLFLLRRFRITKIWSTNAILSHIVNLDWSSSKYVYSINCFCNQSMTLTTNLSYFGRFIYFVCLFVWRQIATIIKQIDWTRLSYLFLFRKIFFLLFISHFFLWYFVISFKRNNRLKWKGKFKFFNWTRISICALRWLLDDSRAITSIQLKEFPLCRRH